MENPNMDNMMRCMRKLIDETASHFVNEYKDVAHAGWFSYKHADIYTGI